MSVFGGQPAGVLRGFFLRVLASGLYSHVLYTGLVGMGIGYVVSRRSHVSRARRVWVCAGLCGARRVRSLPVELAVARPLPRRAVDRGGLAHGLPGDGGQGHAAPGLRRHRGLARARSRASVVPGSLADEVGARRCLAGASWSSWRRRGFDGAPRREMRRRAGGPRRLPAPPPPARAGQPRDDAFARCRSTTIPPSLVSAPTARRCATPSRRSGCRPAGALPCRGPSPGHRIRGRGRRRVGFRQRWTSTR